jgi:hypothetical protein
MRRLWRAKVLDTLESRVKQFRPREELWPLRVPREPLLLGELVGQALGGDAPAFDIQTLRSRTLLRLEWADGSAWDAWVLVLPSHVKLYCDSDGVEVRVLASGGPNEGDDSDRAFLMLLAESAGEHFGIEMAGGPPSRVRSTMERAFLIDLFVELFEVTRMEDSVRQAVATPIASQPPAVAEAADFRSDVERWLDEVS